MIEVYELSKKFGDFCAVDRVSFSVPEGVIFGFLGPNGAGKTTTIRMLTTMLRPTGGRMLVDGHDPVKEQYQVRRSFGIVFQDPSLDEELTAFENMDFHGVLYGLPSWERRQNIEKLLCLVELEERQDELVKFFSTGMKRRLEVARALLHQPKILFLDEPTLGLDPQTRKRIWDYIKDLNQGQKLTVFFTTHYLDEVERAADQIAIIDQGRIIVNDTPSNIKNKTGSSSLEDAFILLTGKVIRDEDPSAMDRMRLRRKFRRKR